MSTRTAATEPTSTSMAVASCPTETRFQARKSTRDRTAWGRAWEDANNYRVGHLDLSWSRPPGAGAGAEARIQFMEGRFVGPKSAGQQEGRPNYATEWTNFTW